MKRYVLLILVSFFVLGVFDTKANGPLDGKIIAVDAGHGGADPGTTYKDIYEKDIVLNISKYLKNELTKRGVHVLLTREGDYDLSNPNAFYRKKSDFDNRIRIVNEADFYVSIHLNYLEDTRYKGIQVFSSKANKSTADVIQAYLNKALNSNRKAKLIPSQTYMYNRLSRPGLLIECGFLSNSSERSLLITEEYQKQIAKEIARGLTKINI